MLWWWYQWSLPARARGDRGRRAMLETSPTYLVVMVVVVVLAVVVGGGGW